MKGASCTWGYPVLDVPLSDKEGAHGYQIWDKGRAGWSGSGGGSLLILGGQRGGVQKGEQ